MVFIFSIWAIATLTKSADYRESAIVVNSEVFQTQIYTPILSFSNLIFEISADDYNGLTEKKDIDSEVKKTETVVFRLITEIRNNFV